MAPRSREQRLFGAACLKITLEQNGKAASSLSIFQETLDDLGLTESEVDLYLEVNRANVEQALATSGAI